MSHYRTIRFFKPSRWLIIAQTVNYDALRKQKTNYEILRVYFTSKTKVHML